MDQFEELGLKEDQLFEAHTKLLSSLKKEVNGMKSSVQNFSKEKFVPQVTYYEGIKFTEPEIKEIAGMYDSGTFNPKPLEYLLNQKVIRNAHAIAKEREAVLQNINDVRQVIKRTNNNNNNLPSSESFYHQLPLETTKLSEDEKLYQDWTGSREIPKKWKHFLAQAGQQYFPDSPVFVPFKPPYWQTKTEEEKEKRNPEESKISRNASHDSHGDRRKQGSLWSKINLEEFFYTIPWLNGLSVNQIQELEKEMTIMEYEDNETICHKGDPVVFTLIKQGNVGVYQSHEQRTPTGTTTSSHKNDTKFQTLYPGSAYGFPFDVQNPNALISKYNYKAIGDVILLTWSLETFNSIYFASFTSNISDGGYSQQQQGSENNDNVDDLDFIEQFSYCGLLLENNSFTNHYREDDINRFAYVEILHEMKKILIAQKERNMQIAAQHAAAMAGNNNNSPQQGALKKRMSLRNVKKYLSNDFYEYPMEEILKLFTLSTPELDFKDMIDEWIVTVKALFSIDRLGLYSLDRDNNLMYLFTSEIANNNNNNNKDENNTTTTNTVTSMDSSQKKSKNSAVTTIRMPLKGVAAQVAKNNKILNIEDCYKSEFFDSAMDVKIGYRTQQMLCIPIHHIANNKLVIGVLQFINPNPSRIFSKEDEIVGTLVTKLIAPYLMDLQKKAINYNLYRPLYHCDGILQFSLKKYFTKFTNRHMKFVCRGTLGNKNITPLKVSNTLYSVNMFNSGAKTNRTNNTMGTRTTTAGGGGVGEGGEEEDYYDDTMTNVDGGGFNECDINSRMEFPNLQLMSLSPNTLILFEFFSKNNHPTGWAIFSLFHLNHYFYSEGIYHIPLISGGCPEDYTLRMERYHLCLRYFEKNPHLLLKKPVQYESSQYHWTDHGLKIRQQYLKKIQQFSAGYLEIELHNNQLTYYEEEQRVPFHFYDYRPLPVMNHASPNAPIRKQFSTIAEWIQSLSNVPENKKKKFIQQIHEISFYYLSTTKLSHLTLTMSAATNTSNNNTTSASSAASTSSPAAAAAVPANAKESSMDQETKEFLWNYRELFLESFPQYFPMILLTIFDFTNRSHMKWLIHKISTTSIPITIPTMMCLLDPRLTYGRLTTYALSSLTTLPCLFTSSESTNFALSMRTLQSMESIFFFFIQTLKGQLYNDSIIIRFFYCFFLLLSNSENSCLAQQTCSHQIFWFFTSYLMNCPILESNFYYYYKELLSFLPFNSYRILLTNGWHFLQYLCLVDWKAFHRFSLSNSGNGNGNGHGGLSGMAINELFTNFTMKDFYLPFSALYNSSSSSSSSSPFSSSGTSNKVEEAFYFTEVLEIIPSVITLPINNTIPSFIRYQLILKSSEFNQNTAHYSSTTSQKGIHKDYYFIPNHPFHKSEMIFQQLMKMINFILFQNGKESFPMGFQMFHENIFFIGIENNAILQDIPVSYTSIQSLIVNYMHAMGKTLKSLPNTLNTQQSKRGGGAFGFLSRSASTNKSMMASDEDNSTTAAAGGAITKIPEDLLSSHLSSRILMKEEETGEKIDIDEVKTTFLHSLAAYLLSSYVLHIGGVNASNSYIADDGRLFFRNPAFFLGLESYELPNPSGQGKVKPALFLLPSFVEMIGGRNSVGFNTLQALINKAYLILRREAGVLAFTIRSYMTYQQFPEEEIDIMLGFLRDTLKLQESDQAAITAMWEVFARALNADYQLRVKA